VAVSLLKTPHGGFRSETAVTKPFQKWSGYTFITATSNGHSPTDTIVRGRWPKPTVLFWCGNL
jgi:hypothetical protein